MRKMEKLFLTGCGYSILILTLFYAFAGLAQFTTPAITPAQYALIVAFGFITAFAELIYNITNLKKIFRCLIHYGVLLVAFCLIFVISGNIKSGKASAIFVSIVIFTMLYFSLWVIVHLVRKTISMADDKIETRSSENNKKQEKYTPRYKN